MHFSNSIIQVIHRSQLLFLQQVKWGISGVFFPAYYELAPAHTLPEEYLPQVGVCLAVDFICRNRCVKHFCFDNYLAARLTNIILVAKLVTNISNFMHHFTQCSVALCHAIISPPQVMDKIGAEGRPIGVVEVNRTIRVLDVFGDYLHVNLHNQLGEWLCCAVL